MNTVDLRRTRRKGLACAAVAAFATLAVMPALAEVANPNLVPAESAYILSVPNAPALWTAWEGNGLYDAFNKVKAMPEVQEQTSDFTKEMSIIESSLGFKLDGPTLSKTFSAVDIYAQPSGTKAVDVVGIFKVADAEKVSKLLDLAEKAAAKSAESDDSSTTGTTDSDKATSAVQEVDYNGVKIKAFKTGEDGATRFVYARTGDFLLMAGNEDSLKKAIDRSKAATPGADTVAASEQYKKIDAVLAKEKGEVYVYGNQALSSKMSSGDMPSTLRGPLESLMSSMQPVTYYGGSVKISPKEIFAYSYGILKDGWESSLVGQNKGDQPLKVASYLPENTILAIATSLVDADSIAKFVTALASTTDEGSGLSDKVKSAEAALGFSVKNDLVPAIGNQVAFSLNNVEFGGLIPAVDATIIIGVKDKAKMAKVTGGIERLVTNMMAAKATDSETSAPAFKSEEVDGQTIKYAEMQGLAGLTPGYVLTDEFLFIGSTKGALSGALKANSGGKNLAAGAALTKLGHGLSANANMIQYVDVSKILSIAKQVTAAIPAAKNAGKYIDAINVIDASGSTSRVEEGGVVGRGVLKLK
jgi:hypothetical protein